MAFAGAACLEVAHGSALRLCTVPPTSPACLSARLLYFNEQYCWKVSAPLNASGPQSSSTACALQCHETPSGLNSVHTPTTLRCKRRFLNFSWRVLHLIGTKWIKRPGRSCSSVFLRTLGFFAKVSLFDSHTESCVHSELCCGSFNSLDWSDLY